MSKTVRIKESELVDLIESIVEKTVKNSKKEWIAEQEKKQAKLLESKVREIASKVIKGTK